MPTPERLILIDASSLIYRAYYAIPANFSTADGLHTNAIYGFATMFRKGTKLRSWISLLARP